jgi:hypothetical protein
MRPEWENYCPDHVIFQGTTEPHYNRSNWGEIQHWLAEISKFIEPYVLTSFSNARLFATRSIMALISFLDFPRNVKPKSQSGCLRAVGSFR